MTTIEIVKTTYNSAKIVLDGEYIGTVPFDEVKDINGTTCVYSHGIVVFATYHKVVIKEESQ